MSLISFHRFLIGTAIVFCLGFAYWELSSYQVTGNLGTAVVGAGFAVAGVLLGYYLKNLARFLGTPSEGGGPAQTTTYSPNGHKPPASEALPETKQRDDQ